MSKSLALLLGAGVLAGCSAIPESARHSGDSRERVARAEPNFSNAPETRQCLANLGTSQARFEPLPDQYHGGGCATLGTVRLAALQTDLTTIGVANIGPVTCPVAETFAAWARFGVDRAARQILGSPLRSIETMGSYSCRNVAGTGRLSAHATADAVDVAAFLLEDGRRISVLGGWEGGTPEERAFLRLVHESACKRFGTVLGPDYNAAHHDHFHVEKVVSGRAYCR